MYEPLGHVLERKLSHELHQARRGGTHDPAEVLGVVHLPWKGRSLYLWERLTSE